MSVWQWKKVQEVLSGPWVTTASVGELTVQVRQGLADPGASLIVLTGSVGVLRAVGLVAMGLLQLG